MTKNDVRTQSPRRLAIRVLGMSLLGLNLLGMSTVVLAQQATQARPVAKTPLTSTDPTRPYWFVGGTGQGGGSEQASLNLIGVWQQEGKQLAYINDRFYRVGDSLFGWKIEQIKPKKVLLSQGSKQRELNLFTHTEFKMEPVK